MGDGAIFLVLLLIVILLLWVFIWGPKAKVAREERERLAAEARAKREAEVQKLKIEREDLLGSIRSRAPKFILDARRDFEREYRAKGSGSLFGQEMSPLVCFGYRVGKTNGRTEAERRAILSYVMGADFEETLAFLPASYRHEWGGPLSTERFNRIVQHLRSLASLRDERPNFQVAVAHWRDDASWLFREQRPIVEKYRDL